MTGMVAMQGRPIRTTPYVGQMVHYVSHGMPPREDGSQAYPSACRSAVVTAVQDEVSHEQGACVALCVLNPTGQFFQGGIRPDQGTYVGGERTITLKLGDPVAALPLITCDDLDFAPGTWHFIAHPEAP